MNKKVHSKTKYSYVEAVDSWATESAEQRPTPKQLPNESHCPLPHLSEHWVPTKKIGFGLNPNIFQKERKKHLSSFVGVAVKRTCRFITWMCLSYTFLTHTRIASSTRGCRKQKQNNNNKNSEITTYQPKKRLNNKSTKTTTKVMYLHDVPEIQWPLLLQVSTPLHQIPSSKNKQKRFKWKSIKEMKRN
jgi:hypothetical protein